MKEIYSVEIDKYSPMALATTIKKLADNIPHFEYEWRLYANGGGIDYGIYLNVDINKKEITICNQPEYGTDGDDLIDDVLDAIMDDEDEEIREMM